MTVPNKETVRVKGAQSRSPKKKANLELVAFLLLCLAVSFFVAVRKTMEVVEHHDIQASSRHEHAHEIPVRKVGTEYLEHEDMFSATIKSCLPENDKKCKMFIPERSTSQRVALVAPPGDIAQTFHRLLKAVVGTANRKKKLDADIEVVLTSHIPPYGYGKNHGWTKIIRIVPRPLLLGTTDTIQATLDVGVSLEGITVDDIKSSLRQQVRYHCRLSHIAAHTALWSIDTETLADMSLGDLIEEIQIFLGLDTDDILEEMEGNVAMSGEGDLFQDMGSRFIAMTSYGASMLTHAQLLIQPSIMKELDSALLEEMRISKNLTAWPCGSFWTVGDSERDSRELSPIVKRIAEALSPDCSAPFTSCFVQRDICEAKGDGKCRKKL